MSLEELYAKVAELEARLAALENGHNKNDAVDQLFDKDENPAGGQ